MQRLSSDTLHLLPDSVARPRYDRSQLKAGILHLGIGAFHRAHQAVYTEQALNNSGGDWGIIAASMRSPNAAQQLNPQDGLFTVCAENGEGQEQALIGSIKKVLVAPQEPDALDTVIADPAIKVITLTITEKGYCLGDNGWSLNTELPEIQQDLQHPSKASTAIGMLARGLQQRHDIGGAPLTIISCDNLTENSRRLHACLMHYIRQCYPEIVPWMEQSVRFPCSMVDRIVPAMNEQKLSQQANTLGLRDEASVVTEPFTQWVIEDKFATDLPDWQSAGVLLVADIKPFESTKLRLLNASHSAIAYVGLVAGLETVSDVMVDPQMGDFIKALMNRELIPALTPPPGMDIHRYSEQLQQRFSNPCLKHQCAQIAMDGSEKIPLRWQQTLDTLPTDSLLMKALACWSYYILQTDLSIADPRQSALLAQRNSSEPLNVKLVRLLQCLRLGDQPDITKNRSLQLQTILEQMDRNGVRNAIASVT